jgi:hypothetical protein
MSFPGYVKPTDVMVDAGVLYRRDPDGASLIGVGPTRGGLKFNPGKTIRNIEFDGKTTSIAGLDRITEWNSEITGMMIDFSAENFGMYEPGNTSGSSGSALRISPLQATEFLAEGAYIYDLLWIGRAQDNRIKVVGFPCALVSQYDISAEDKSEAGGNVTFQARLPVDATNINECPFRIFTANSIAELDAIFPAFWSMAGYVGAP